MLPLAMMPPAEMVGNGIQNDVHALLSGVRRANVNIAKNALTDIE